MVKLIFKAYKKTDKIFFFLYIKINNFEKKDVKDIKNFLKKKKTKSTNMLVSDIEIFLKKKKKRSVNMVVKEDVLEIFWRMRIENIFL